MHSVLSAALQVAALRQAGGGPARQPAAAVCVVAGVDQAASVLPRVARVPRALGNENAARRAALQDR